MTINSKTLTVQKLSTLKMFLKAVSDDVTVSFSGATYFNIRGLVVVVK